MEKIAGLLFWGGFIVAYSDGPWFPWVNFIGLATAIIGARLITQPFRLPGEGK